MVPALYLLDLDEGRCLLKFHNLRASLASPSCRPRPGSSRYDKKAHIAGSDSQFIEYLGWGRGWGAGMSVLIFFS